MSATATGLRAWLVQRISAVYLAGFTVYLGGLSVIAPPISYSDWHGHMASTVVILAWALFFVALMLHAWVGIRDVLLDYIPMLWLRLGLLCLVGAALVVMGLWAALVLFRLMV